MSAYCRHTTVATALLLCWLAVRPTFTVHANYFESFAVEPASHQNRNAIKMDRYKWPRGEVPFVFDEKYDEHDIKAILDAMEIFSSETCVQFIPKKTHNIGHIKFVKSTVCGSSIGYRHNQAEPLDVFLSEFCIRLPGAIQHELLHVLGLLHEQARPDRDDYVTILWDNIDPRYFQNFRKADNDTVDTFGLPYDYGSLLHYPGNAFAKTNRNVTIVSKNDPLRQLGQSVAPSFNDLEKVRRMYNC